MAYRNTNPLVKSAAWDVGLSKTGYIHEAGKCLVMQARVADKPVVIVLLDSAGKQTRVGDANRIKRWMETTRLRTERRRMLRFHVQAAVPRLILAVAHWPLLIRPLRCNPQVIAQSKIWIVGSLPICPDQFDPTHPTP